jgi:hopanoid biosynthesis associated protein HpnK
MVLDSPPMDKRLIVSADDFGLSREVNDAVERAHREGVLASASLMVAAPATDDAVRRARALPTLRVGLHLVLVNGRPALAPERVRALVDRDGNFPSDLGAAGVRYFFHPGARGALRAEIRAQFEAYARTGLPLDHVNAQNHFHVHPTVLGILLEIGPQFGMRAVRIPAEPGDAALLQPWLALMRARLQRAGMRVNDRVYGIKYSGHMTRERVLEILPGIPGGISELYFHPATRAWDGIDPQIAAYDFAGELDALTSGEVRTAIAQHGLTQTTYSDLP